VFFSPNFRTHFGVLEPVPLVLHLKINFPHITPHQLVSMTRNLGMNHEPWVDRSPHRMVGPVGRPSRISTRRSSGPRGTRRPSTARASSIRSQAPFRPPWPLPPNPEDPFSSSWMTPHRCGRHHVNTTETPGSGGGGIFTGLCPRTPRMFGRWTCHQTSCVLLGISCLPLEYYPLPPAPSPGV